MGDEDINRDLSVNELIIGYVQNARPLWDLRDKRYHDNNLKANLWIDISRELGIEVEELKKKWKNLRDRFTKCMHEQKGKSGQGATYKKPWALLPSLEFFRDTIKPRRTVDSFEADYGAESPQLNQSSGGLEEVVDIFSLEVCLEETHTDSSQAGAAAVTPSGAPLHIELPPPWTPISVRPPAPTTPILVPVNATPLSPPLIVRPPTPSPTISRSSPVPSSARSSPAPSSSSSGEMPPQKKVKRGRLEDPVDAAFLNFLQQRTAVNANNQPRRQELTPKELTPDEHFYMHIAKEAQSLSKVRRTRLRHAVSAKLLEFMEEEEEERGQ